MMEWYASRFDSMMFYFVLLCLCFALCIFSCDIPFSLCHVADEKAHPGWGPRDGMGEMSQ